jgi:hypothetical protein
MSPIPTAECPECGFRKRVTVGGTLYAHRAPETEYLYERQCTGGGTVPSPATVRDHSVELVAVEPYEPDWFERHYNHIVYAGCAALFLAMVAIVVGLWGAYR